MAADDDDDDVLRASSRIGELDKKVRGIDRETRNLTSSANAFAKAISGAFVQGATGAKSFESVLKSLGLRLSGLAVNMAMKPITSSLAGNFEKLFSGLFGGGGGGTGGTNLRVDPITGAAQPMAKGGVIAAPTYFPLGGSGLGLAGEAGSEAIMPLARGADGRLGVAASGSAGGNVTVNIATPDAESFRRSETYLTGLIARAVARGQRGM